MKFSEEWLREWINPPITSSTLYKQLTESGLEVESSNRVFTLLEHLVIGQIVCCNKKLNSECLFFLKVDIGKSKIINITTKFVNCYVGMKVIILKNKQEKYLIGEKKIQFQEGNICSFADLKMFASEKGAIELPSSAIVGSENLSDYFSIFDNTIKVNIPYNRPDAIGILGISREIAILNNMEIPKVKVKNILPIIKNNFQIKINIPEICPRYIGRCIRDININIQTPFWIKEKLRRCHITSVNIITDVLNYVLMELGQPVHVFNTSNISNNFFLRKSKKNESFVRNNQYKVNLPENIIVLSDDSKIFSLLDNVYFIDNNNKKNIREIFIGSVFINTELRSDKNNYFDFFEDVSLPYDKIIDPSNQHYAIEYATDLLINFCGGKPSDIINNTAPNFSSFQKKIIFFPNKIKHFIGQDIDNDIILKTFLKLGYKVSFFNDNTWEVFPPSWRGNIVIEEELIEDFMRIYGYKNIFPNPIVAQLNCDETKNNLVKNDFYLNRVKLSLADKGYHEVISYSFVDPYIQRQLYPKQLQISLLNPITQDMSVMRLSLLYGLLKNLSYNQLRNQESLRLFESGLCFSIKTLDNYSDVNQEFFLSGVITGPHHIKHWDWPDRTLDFFDIKGDVESILETIVDLHIVDFKNVNLPDFFHPAKSAAIYIYDKVIVGFLGCLHPKFQKMFNIKDNIMFFEIFWGKLIKFYKSKKYKKVSDFPVSKRDLSIIVSENINSYDIIKECKKSNSNIFKIYVFDVYRGAPIKTGNKSLSLSIIFKNTVRTLNEDDITHILNQCIDRIKVRFGATLR